MCPALGEVTEPARSCSSAILLWVVVGAVRLSAASAMLTLLKLEEVRMILLFFPSMRGLAHILQLAPIYVSSNKIIRLPTIAHLWLVSEYWWLPPVILPIMSIHAHLPVVVIVSVRAPDSLEVIHVEVHVNLVVFNQLNRQLFSSMSERAKLTVFASLLICSGRSWTFWREVEWTELGFILIRMVKLFNSVVSQITSISLVAVSSSFSVLTNLRLVGSERPASISFHIMIVRTLLVVMHLRI